jgi:hypothetical protein
MPNVVVHTVLVMRMTQAATEHLALNCPSTMQKQLASVFHLQLRVVQLCLMV